MRNGTRCAATLLVGALLHPAPVVMAQDGGPAPAPPDGGAAAPLEGTRWRWVRFTGPDGKQLVPAHSASYWIELRPAGELVLQADCNRGHGRWSQSGKKVKLQPLAITLMACPPGTLASRFLQLLGQAASYRLRNGHLALTLQAEGGVMQLAPLEPATPPTPPR
jgi:heat shock protein HslJ